MKIKKISPILLTILSSFLLSITNSEVHAWPWNRWGSDQNVRRDGAPPPPPESKSKSPSPESTNESSTPEIDPLEELKLVIDEIENDLRQMGYESSQLSEILHEIRYIQSYLQMNDRPLTVAIHGDGNSGKSTLFNLLYGRSAMTVEASLGTTPETGLGLPGNIDRDDVLFEQILRHKKTGGLGAARLFGAAGAWTKVFGNYQESPEWVLLDSPSYTRAEFSFMLDEISQLSDVALAMVPRDYLSDDFLHFIRTWSAKGKSIALVFNERDPNFAKIDAKTAQSIAREISKATGAKDLGQFKLTQAGENEAPQFSLLNSKSASPNQSPQQAVAQFLADSKIDISNARQARLARLQQALKNLRGEVANFGNFLDRVQAATEMHAQINLNGVVDNPLGDAFEAAFMRSQPLADRGRAIVLRAANLGSRVVGQKSNLVRGKVMARVAQMEVDRQNSYRTRELEVFQNAFVDLVAQLEQLKAEGGFSPEIQNALELITSTSYFSGMYQKFERDHRSSPIVSGHMKKEISAYINYLKEHQPSVYKALANADKRNEYMGAIMNGVLTMVAPVVIGNVIGALSRSVILGTVGGGVGLALYTVLVLPRALAASQSARKHWRGSKIYQQWKSDRGYARKHGGVGKIEVADSEVDGEEELPGAATESTEVALEDDFHVDDSAEDDPPSEEVDAAVRPVITDLKGMHIQERQKWYMKWMARHYLKPLIAALQKTSDRKTIEQVARIDQLLSCASFVESK